MTNKNNIYVVLIKAHTGLGNIARKISKYEYTHISVCLNDELNDFITFSRKKHFAPFDSGFMHETLDCYAFGNHKNVKLKVFCVPVPDRNMSRILQFIKKVENDSEYIFNIYSMVTMPVFHGFKIYKAHNCMSFVGKILKLSGAVRMKKPHYKYDIKEMDDMLTPYFMSEKMFEKAKIETTDYMDKVSVLHNLKMFFKLNCELIRRLR